MAVTPISQDEKDEILRLHKLGWTRSLIASTVGRAQSSVTLVVQAAGLSFDRAPTAAAVAAFKEDAAKRRQRIALKMQIQAEKMLDEMDSPMEVFNFGGKDNTFNSERVSKPPTQAKRDLSQAAAVLLKSAAELDARDGDPSAEAKSALLGLGIALGLIPKPEPIEPAE